MVYIASSSPLPHRVSLPDQYFQGVFGVTVSDAALTASSEECSTQQIFCNILLHTERLRLPYIVRSMFPLADSLSVVIVSCRLFSWNPEYLNTSNTSFSAPRIERIDMGIGRSYLAFWNPLPSPLSWQLSAISFYFYTTPQSSSLGLCTPHVYSWYMLKCLQ